MNLDELKKNLNSIEEKYTKEKNLAIRAYCFSNNSVKLGDIFTDHIGPIRVEEIRFCGGNNPCCVYVGPELTKKLEPKKNGSRRHAWQRNEVKI